MSSYTELLGYSKQLERRLAALERQEAGGAFYTRSEADAKFLTILDAAAQYLDISAYGDFLLATGQATGALIFPQIFSRGIYSYDGIWGSGDPNGDLILEGTSDATKTSSYVILQPTGGKVGIGTSTPGDKLHVAGGGILLDNDNWFRVMNTSGTAIEVAGINASDDVYLGAIANAGGKVVIREDGSDVITITGANVGIGTSPSEKLEVNGNTLIPNNSWYKAKTSGGTAIQLLGIDGSNNVFIGAVGNAGGAVYIREDGSNIITITGANVGISAAVPGYKLDVNGKINSQGDQLLFSGGSGLGADQGDTTATLYNRASVGPTVSGSQFSIRTGTPAPAERLRIGATGQTTLYGTAAATALRLDNGGFSMNGSDTFAVDAVGTVGGRFYINSSGNVGIGTNSPSQKLDVNGVIKTRGDQLLFEGGSGLGADQGDATATLYNRAGVGPTFSGLQVAFRTGATPAERLRIDSSGNIGIGTGSPGDKLHVAGGGVLLNNNNWFRVKNTGGTIIELLGIDSSNNVYMGAVANAGGKVFIREDGADVITLHTGNVGIGTTNPQNFKLQVEGRVGVKTGVNAASAMMWVYQDDNGATIPVLRLTQSDLSEEFIYFNATVGTNYPIDTAALGTYYGKVRVSVNGTFKYMPLYNS